MFGDDRHVCSWYWTHNVVYICPYGKSPVWGRFCAWNQPLPPHPSSLDLSALKRKTHAEFALFWVARKMSLGKEGWGVKLLRVARVTLQWSVWLIMSRVRTVRGESVAFSHRFSVLLCCALFFTRLVYRAGGVSPVVTVWTEQGRHLWKYGSDILL